MSALILGSSPCAGMKHSFEFSLMDAASDDDELVVYSGDD